MLTSDAIHAHLTVDAEGLKCAIQKLVRATPQQECVKHLEEKDNLATVSDTL